MPVSNDQLDARMLGIQISLGGVAKPIWRSTGEKLHREFSIRPRNDGSDEGDGALRSPAFTYLQRGNKVRLCQVQQLSILYDRHEDSADPVQAPETMRLGGNDLEKALDFRFGSVSIQFHQLA